MPHHHQPSAAWIAVGMGQRNRTVPSQRRGRDAWQAGLGITLPPSGQHGISKAQNTSRAWWDTALHPPDADPQPLGLTPGMLWPVAPGNRSTLSKLMSPGLPKLSPAPLSTAWVFLFAVSSLLSQLSHALQVSSSQMLPLQQRKAQQGKQGGESNASSSTGSRWLQQL